MSRNVSDLIKGGDAAADWILCDLSEGEKARFRSLADLDRDADRIARGLTDLGCAPGDVVAVMAFNRLEFLSVFLGILRAGAVAAPINNRLSTESANFILKDSGAILLFRDASGPEGLDGSFHTLHLDTNAYAAFGTQGPFVSHQSDANDPALILYTSGSTGLPKGVMHGHAGLMALLVESGVLAEPLYKGRGIVAAPLYHMNGLLYSLIFLAAGGSVVLLPRFEARRYVAAIDRYRVTSVTGVPPMIAMIAREPELIAGLDLDCVTSVTLGSAPLSEAVVGQAGAVFPRATVTNVYGTTETGVPFAAHPAGLPTPPTSVGHAAGHVELRLVDGPDVDSGVLEVRAPGLMLGYRNQPGLTAARVRDGWYRTGDRFSRDSDGFYYFIGREDDMFVCGGENIYPIEVERILERMPGVAQACVTPVPDARRGQMPVAFVAPAPGARITEAEVKAFALLAGPEYMHPRHVFLLDELPVSAVNKIDRAGLLAEALRRLSPAGTGGHP